jgi:hypothetical protein
MLIHLKRALFRVEACCEIKVKVKVQNQNQKNSIY